MIGSLVKKGYSLFASVVLLLGGTEWLSEVTVKKGLSAAWIMKPKRSSTLGDAEVDLMHC